MNDLFFIYNTSSDVTNETKVEFLYREFPNANWSVRVNNKETHWSIVLKQDSDCMYYDLELNGEPIKMFDFNGQTIRYIPNLFKVWKTILKNGLNIVEQEF